MNITSELNNMGPHAGTSKKEMVNNQDWELLKGVSKESIVNLLENAVYFIDQVPNHKYKCKDFHCSYDLACEIDATLKILKK
jgi:beta-galactosidase beta subunit